MTRTELMVMLMATMEAVNRFVDDWHQGSDDNDLPTEELEDLGEAITKAYEALSE